VRLSALVAGGEQIPFDVAEQDGPESAFYLYRPLTSRFVREREDELRALPTFLAARDAIDAAGVAAGYLEARGEQVPGDPRERAARMIVVFLSSLWDGCTEFALDRERLDGALAALDAEARDADDAEIVIAPIVGLRMGVAALDLPHGVRIVRADAVDAPLEAMRSEGMGRSAWEPQFLAVAEQGEGPGSAAAAVGQLRGLISTMRIFKAGGVGLGPYAFAPADSGSWRRIPSGAPAARPGGYRLSEDEAAELSALARGLEERPPPGASLAWAVARFEMGCARETASEGLSDHLLALRAVLEGHGPVGASLPLRAAALIAEQGGDREEAKQRVEDALELERALMSGASREGGLGLASWLEDGVRRILREAALGGLGSDLGAAAEETLIATGLDAGDGSIVGTTSDWETPETGEVEVEVSGPEQVREEELETGILEPVPGEDEIRITATDWLGEVSDERGTMEWSAAETGVGRRERIDTPTVRHLFPVPEDADWEVRELEYNHYTRRVG
jgi:hypothetical protein